MCAIPQAQLSQPPVEYENELVETQIAGKMPCGGLYYALQQGVLPSNLCSTIQQAAGPSCCSLPALGGFDIPPGGGGGGGGGGGDSAGESDTCLLPGQECEANDDCCLGDCEQHQALNMKTCKITSGGGSRDRYGYGTGRGGRGGAGGGRNLRTRES